MNECNDWQNGNANRRKYVFVCGLPRSGTSMLGRYVGRLQDCSSLKNTGVLEDEGTFLQDVYPTEQDCGGPGRFGFDPRVHLTEMSHLLTRENVAKLLRSWHVYWDNEKTIFVEKTPANLLMTRFLQAAFPNSYFVVIRRHPVPVSIAIQKWKVTFNPLHSLFEHWLHCHEIFEQDKKYLKHVYELSYEDYVQNPDKYHQEIAAFLGTRVSEPPEQDTFRYVVQWRNPRGLRIPENTMEEITGAHNQRYFNHWHHLLTKSRLKSYYRYIAEKYEPWFVNYGYSVTQGVDFEEGHLRRAGKVSGTVGALFCLVAGVWAFMVRLVTRSQGKIRTQIRSRLPEALKVKIKRLVQRMRVSPASLISFLQNQ
jgi:hypothetical protein